MTSSKMPLSQNVASKLSLCDTKSRTVVEKNRNRNVIDWRNWNKSLFGENLSISFGSVDRRVGSGRRRSTRTSLCSSR